MDRENSEITKLTERIAKDPKSKLFVPLAEEYKKIGDIETAIYVLTEGLKNNPGYATARSFLGRLLMDKGDLAGAQKEFEDVVKAIPDNLLAQRKLGDIYALQGKADNAIAHYKAVVALNPKDQETVVLIADLEAGRGVTGRIAKTKPQPVADQAKTPEKLKPAVPPPVQAAAAQPIPNQPLSPQPSKPAEKTAPSRTARPAPEPEAAEEVLVVEPLEPEHAGQEPSSGVPDFLAEKEPEPVAADSGQGVVSGGFFEDESQVLDESQLGEEVLETVVFPAEGEAEVPAESLKKSDDFTTDTLAELYIAQGFYEKAIDIYDRMLAENPGHQGLTDKLARLRSLAAESGGAEEEKPEAGSIPVFESFDAPQEGGELAPSSEAGGREYVPPRSDGLEEQPPFGTGLDLAGTAEEASFAAQDREAQEYVPPAPEEPEPAPSSGGGFDLSEREPAPPPAEEPETSAEFVPSPVDDFEQTPSVSEDFKSVEYFPAEPELPEAPAEYAGPKTPKGGRKETISRLEQWLKNITKEK
jgi:tetratricopeptide (TPR) repeat protein